MERNAKTMLFAKLACDVLTQYRFGLGDRVRKISGSQWQGCIVGFYSTSLTEEGYAVESELHPGSVQIYPAKALEVVPAPNKGARDE